MYSGLIAGLVLILGAIFFLIYKRHMIARLFSLDIASQVDDFKYDLQSTANRAVDKINLSSKELAELLQQAEETIEELKLRTKIAEEQLYKNAANDLRSGAPYLPSEQAQAATAQTFVETLLQATKSTAVHLDLPNIETPPPFMEYYGQASARQTEEEPEEQGVEAFPALDMSNAEPKFKHKQIMRLAASGYTDIDIAKTLGLGVGEVSLTRKFGVK